VKSFAKAAQFANNAAVDTNEQRRYPRSSADEATFRVHCGVTEAPLRLVDFSAEGLSVVFDRIGDVEGREVIPLLLASASAGARGAEPFARLALRVASGMRTGTALRVGGRIVTPEFLPFGAATPSGPGDASEIHDASTTRDVLDHLRAYETVVRLRAADGEAYSARAKPGACDGDTLSLSIASRAPLPPQRASLSFDIDGGGFALHSSLKREADGHVLAAPFVLVSRSRRHSDRVHVPPHRAKLSWPNALVPGERVIAEVVDLSPIGARARVGSPSSFPPPPGGRVLLHLDGLALSLGAEVRHVDRDAREGSMSFGLRLVPEGTRDVVRLARAVESIRFPRLQPRASVPRATVANLLRTSGYLDLRDSAQDLTPWHDTPEPTFSIDAVHVQEDESLDGHISCTRIYENTWIFHQLATIGNGKLAMQSRRALYLSVTGWVSLLAGLTEKQGYAVAYFDRSKRWHNTFFESFTRWTGDKSLAVITPLDRFEPAATSEDAHESGESFEVGVARDDELAHAEAILRASMPRLQAEAMDVRTGRLSTPVLCAEHAAEGMERARTLLVVREQGSATAFALCETGSPRLSLFNLLNLAHIVATPAASNEARRALLAGVRAFYTAKGIAAPLVVASPGTLGPESVPGLALAETMGCLVLSAEGLKQYRNFLTYHFGRFVRSSP
jgi:hypothetical protein